MRRKLIFPSQVPPHYLNLQDAFLHPFPPNPRGPKTPTAFQFALNSAGDNRILFCAPTLQSLTVRPLRPLPTLPSSPFALIADVDQRYPSLRLGTLPLQRNLYRNPLGPS
jgi:hypothetical protein